MPEPDDTIAALAPVVWWKLDEASGSVAANSGSGGATYDGTVHGVVAFGQPAILPASAATAMDPSGTGYIQCNADSPITGDHLTIIVFMQTDVQAEAAIVEHGNSAGADDEIFRLSTSHPMEILPGPLPSSFHWIYARSDGFFGQDTLRSRPGADGTPHMFYFAYTPTAYAYGVDGVWVEVDNVTGTEGVPTLQLMVGATDGGGFAFQGSIAHVALFDHYVTPAEATAVFAASGILPVVDLYTLPDEFAATILVDNLVPSIDLDTTLDPVTGEIDVTPAVPSNDDLANAIELFVDVVRPGSTVNATVEAGEPPGPLPDDTWPSVWYKLTVVDDEPEVDVTITTPDFEPYLSVYTGPDVGASFATLTLVYTHGGETPMPLYNTVAGTTYYVQVYGWTPSFSGPGVGGFHIGWTIPPTHADIFQVMFPITGEIDVTIGGAPSRDIELASIDGASAPIGPGFVELFDPDAVRDIDLPSIDGASAPAGVTIDHFPIVEIPFAPVTRVELWSRDGVLLSSMDNAFGIRWQDPHNDVGSGSVALPLDDPVAMLIRASTEVRCYLYDQLVYAWEVAQDPKLVTIDTGEEAALEVTADGPGRVSLTGRARIYPVKGLVGQLMGQHRLYSFAAPDFPNADTWPAAWQNLRQDVIDPARHAIVEETTVADGSDFIDVVEELAYAAPLGWQVPTAFWIWNGPDTFPVGFCYFRGSFDLAVETAVVIAATADNFWTLYLDGNPILGETGTTSTWQDHKEVTLLLPAGHYLLAAAVENVPWPGPAENNPAGFLCAVYTVDDKQDLLATIKVSDNSWTCLGYPSTVPGWTPGQIILSAISEAQARGGLAGFTVGFSAFADSSGGPWIGNTGVGSYVPGFSIPIGSSVLDLLRALVDQGWIDYRMQPGGKVLQVWSQGAGNVDSGVVIAQTGSTLTQNIESQTFDPQGEPVTRLFVKWSSGFIQLDDAAAQAQWGVFEGFLTIDAATEPDARAQAQRALTELANPQTAIVVGIDPATTLDRPYVSFGVGDLLTIPDRTGAASSKKLLSISVDEDDMGKPTIVLEFDVRILAREREQFKLFDTLGRGVVGNTKVRNALNTTTDVSHD